MTKINHRQNQFGRRTPAAFDAASNRELAFLDAKLHMATSRNIRTYIIPSKPFVEASLPQPPAGVQPLPRVACRRNCGHPGCVQGCTLQLPR